MRNSRNDCEADSSMQSKIPNVYSYTRTRNIPNEDFAFLRDSNLRNFDVADRAIHWQRKIDGSKKFVRWRLVHRMRCWYCIIRYTNTPNYIGDVVRFDEFSCDASDRRAVDFAVVTLYDSTGTWVFSTKNVKKKLLEGTLDGVGAS